LLCLIFELPLLGGQAGGCFTNPLAVWGVGKVGAVGTASLPKLSGVFIQDPLASLPEDATPVTSEERRIEKICVPFELEGHPFSEGWFGG
jgi:hypothetical protein